MSDRAVHADKVMAFVEAHLRARIQTVLAGNFRRKNKAALFIHFAANFTSQLLAPVSDRVEVIRTLLILAVAIAVWSVRVHVGPKVSGTHRIVPPGLKEIES